MDRCPIDVESLLALCADRLLIDRATAQNKGTNSTWSGSAHLLFKLLRILVDKHGAVHSLEGCTAASPEGLIVSLLLNGPSAQPQSLSPIQGFEQEQLLERVQLYSNFESTTVSSSSSSSGSSSTLPSTSSSLALNTMKDSSKGELFALLESLLLRGKRDEAVAAAVAHREWPIALLIASNCGPDEYREVTKAYATCTFPNASPLHLAALLFSNQVALHSQPFHFLIISLSSFQHSFLPLITCFASFFTISSFISSHLYLLSYCYRELHICNRVVSV